MLEWLHDNQVRLLWMSAISVVMLVVTTIGAKAFVASLPTDFLMHKRRPPRRFEFGRSIGQSIAVVLKNLMGFICVIAGLAMLVLPGQGLLVLLVGFLLIDFPGKYRIEKWMLSRPRVLRVINWVRRRSNRPPLESPSK